MATTAINALPSPTDASPNDPPIHFEALNNQLDTRLLPRFTTIAARDAAITSPVNGMSCWVDTPGLFYDRVGGAWVVRTRAPRFTTTGTIANSGTPGAGGAIDAALTSGNIRGLHDAVTITRPYGTGVPFQGKVTAHLFVFINASSEARLGALGDPTTTFAFAGQNNTGTVAEYRTVTVTDTFDTGTADTYTFQPIIKAQSGTVTPVADPRASYSIVEIYPKGL